MRSIFFSLCLAVSALLSGAVLAYPTQPVRIIAPAPPGSPVDVRARWVADKLSAALGGSVLVENRPGAGGNLGAEAAAKSRPDGHTLVVVHQGILAVNPHVYGRTGFDPLSDFAPITRLLDAALVLMVPAQSPASSLADLLKMARSKPGALSYASSGNGTPPHLATELLRHTTGVDVAHVPYKGATPSLTDLLAGRVAFSIDSLSSHGAHVKAGRLRALAVTGPERLAAVPNVPTMQEAGVPGYEYHSWIGVLAPAGTPPAIVAQLNAALVKALMSQDARDWLQGQGAVPVGDTPEAFAAFIRKEHARWGKLVREAGLRVD